MVNEVLHGSYEKLTPLFFVANLPDKGIYRSGYRSLTYDNETTNLKIVRARKIVLLLRNVGANFNAKSEEGRTALDIAAANHSNGCASKEFVAFFKPENEK